MKMKLVCVDRCRKGSYGACNSVGFILDSKTAKYLIEKEGFSSTGLCDYDKADTYYLDLSKGCAKLWKIGDKNEVSVSEIKIEEPKEMTISDIEKVLGYPIKIVKED